MGYLWMFGRAFLIMIECCPSFGNSEDNRSGWTTEDIINLWLTLALCLSFHIPWRRPRESVLSFSGMFGCKVENQSWPEEPSPSLVAVLKTKTNGRDYVGFARGWRERILQLLRVTKDPGRASGGDGLSIVGNPEHIRHKPQLSKLGGILHKMVKSYCV